jgi:hypothetical protein
VQEYRAQLEVQELAPSTINVQQLLIDQAGYAGQNTGPIDHSSSSCIISDARR